MIKRKKCLFSLRLPVNRLRQPELPRLSADLEVAVRVPPDDRVADDGVGAGVGVSGADLKRKEGEGHKMRRSKKQQI